MFFCQVGSIEGVFGSAGPDPFLRDPRDKLHRRRRPRLLKVTNLPDIFLPDVPRHRANRGNPWTGLSPGSTLLLGTRPTHPIAITICHQQCTMM